MGFLSFDAAEAQGMGFSPVGGSSSGGGPSLASAIASSNAGASGSAGSTGGFDFSGFDPGAYGVVGPEKSAALEKFAGILGSGGTLSQNQADKLASISAKTGVDFTGLFSGIGSLGAGTSTGWSPSTGDQYQFLKPGQEAKLDKFAQMYLAGDISPGKLDKLENLLGKGQLGTVDSFFSPVTYTAPTNLGFAMPAGMTAQDLASYVTQYAGTDPTRVYQYATEYGLTPSNLATVLSGYDVSTPRYGAPTIFGEQQLADLFATGKEGYGTAFGNVLTSTLGTPAEQAALETQLGLPAGSLAAQIDPTKYQNMSIESIERELSSSSFNRAQEAFKVAEAIGGIANLTPDQIGRYAAALYGGKVSGDVNELYQTALQSNQTPRDLQYNYLSNLAESNPDHPFFKNNPDALNVYSPIGETTAQKGSGQYGTRNNLPILNAAEADKILGDKVFQDDNRYFGYGTKRDDSLGWELNSSYLGFIANGSGVFGVKADQNQIDDFSRIESELAKLGGVQTGTDVNGETKQGVYVPTTTSEGQQYDRFVPVEEFFATQYDPESGANNGAQNYAQYQSTLTALNRGAEQFGIDPSSFGSIDQAYNTINELAKDFYVVSGRANSFDPELMASFGLTNDKGEVDRHAHAQVTYQRIGDKLVPIDVAKAFEFADPNTSRGTLGDFVGAMGEVLSAPPVQLALAAMGGMGNLMAEGAGYGAAAQGTGAFDIAGAANLGSGYAMSNLAATVGTNIGSMFNLGGNASILLGNTIVNAGLAGLQSGLAGGSWDSVLTGATAGALGTGIAGLTNNALTKVDGINLSPSARNTIANIVGGTAAVASTGQNVDDYLKSRVVGTGLSWLIDNGIDAASDKSELKGVEKEIFKALVPVMIGEKLGINDLVNIAKALDKADYFQKAA